MPPIRCFISYSHDDRVFADTLATLLGAYHPHLEYFLDDHDLRRGLPLERALPEALASSDVLLAVVSPSWQRSTWCQREVAEFLQLTSRQPSLRILPLIIDAPNAALPSPLANHVGIDLRSWRRDADQLVGGRLVPALLGQSLRAADALSPRQGDAAILASNYKALGTLFSKLDPLDRHGRAYIEMGVALFRTPGMGPRERAVIALAIAAPMLQRGAWKEMADWCGEALSTLYPEGAAEDGMETDGTYNDRDHHLRAELSGYLALALRKLGSEEALKHYHRALDQSQRLQDPLARRAASAGVLRELGTVALARGELDDARQHYTLSRDMLVGLPSQSTHVAVAHVKLAQVELVAGNVEQAQKELDRAQTLLLDEPDGAHLKARVGAHYWKTRALTCLAAGEREAFRRAWDEHRRLYRGQGWSNEETQSRVLWALGVSMRVVPKGLRIGALGRLLRANAGGSLRVGLRGLWPSMG